MYKKKFAVANEIGNPLFSAFNKIHKCYSSVKCKSNFIELFHKVIKSAPKHKR